ncbi:MAG: 2-C-methyl-D-erythritol 2,4-cyclodiphosphate synthase [Bacteroidetes bacterium]|nr:2-C-methyl-D-erythritol 2,4-cyclodiphosphate synthase [Bacteroidota bacterium]HET6243980.1 2-C-methyl-D-erythritol 2,4-cyclodiphosphate synthase [Bacteroidia bacterium]
MKIRIGFGFDVHQLENGKDFWLGGINIPHTKGAVGHSDADVLIHAICDALLGAANMRDIGFHFPNTDPKYKGIDSKELLKEVMRIIQLKGYNIGNIDATLTLENPKINPYIPEMISVLCDVMGIDAECLSIKATTNETLGYVGREQGVNAYAVALIEKNE